MARARHLLPAIVGGLLLAVPLGAQETTGTITGRVIDGPTQQPLAAVTVVIEGTQRGTLSRPDGVFLLTGVPAGTHSVRATRIGYDPMTQQVTVTAGGTTTLDYALTPSSVVLTEMVTVGYGTQRREAVTGSVTTINAEAADVGVTTNVNDMITARAPGVTTVLNNGEPGAGMQIRIRGGSSISADNEPLYVIDGVPINNVETEAAGIGIGGEPALPRDPMNMLNPADIATITILKDASATAIYGSRGANGVILIETKNGAAAGLEGSVEYDGYAAMSAPSNYLDVLSADEYREFVTEGVANGDLPAAADDNLGSANTDWEREITRRAVTHNHNLAFAGGGGTTRYRASLNYMDQQGIVLGNGLKRYQGRLNGTHEALDGRMRLGLNLTTSRVDNDYLAFETTGGFEGGVFINTAIFDPTQPVTVSTPTGAQYYELAGQFSVRNPVALAEQLADLGQSNRSLGNLSVELDLLPGLVGSVILGADQTEGIRRSYIPKANPVGVATGGWARQVSRDNSSVTFQGLLTYRQDLRDVHNVDVVGGYEFAEYSTAEFGADAQGFTTDAFSFNNLGGGATDVKPFSWKEESRAIAFFSRANYSFNDRYFVTGVLRYDGSSRFGAGNKWALFPALSASWRLSEESFMQNAPFGISDLRLRAGWGLQGNPAVPPYASLITLEPTGGATYVFGETPVTGIAPVRNANPNLRWEETSQINLAVDYGFLDDRFSGSVEYYIKNTSDLLLTVPVPQPALVPDRLENIGELRNQGLEVSLDAQVLSRPNLHWTAGLAFAAERNEVISLGGRPFIASGNISGQGQTDAKSQRIMPGEALGTFFGPVYAGVDGAGKQLFRCSGASPDCVNGTTTVLGVADQVVLGDANPDYTLGIRSQVNWGRFDASALVRSEIGKDVFNNTALVYATRTNAKQGKNFLRSALNDPVGIDEPSIFSSRWVEDGSFVRLQNVTVGYTFDVSTFGAQVRSARAFISGDNLLLLTGYDGLDPEVHAEAGLASRGIDYLAYPRARTFTAGVSLAF